MLDGRGGCERSRRPPGRRHFATSWAEKNRESSPEYADDGYSWIVPGRGPALACDPVIPTRKHLGYALGYIELGLFAEAREELDRIPADERQTAPVLAACLELAMAEETWADVVFLAPQVAAADPSNERPWIAWAYALRELQQVAKARDVLLRGAETIAGPSVLVDYNLACYFCLLGDLAEARRRLALVFAREPEWETESQNDPDLAALRAKTGLPD